MFKNILSKITSFINPDKKEETPFNIINIEPEESYDLITNGNTHWFLSGKLLTEILNTNEKEETKPIKNHSDLVDFFEAIKDWIDMDMCSSIFFHKEKTLIENLEDYIKVNEQDYGEDLGSLLESFVDYIDRNYPDKLKGVLECKYRGYRRGSTNRTITDEFNLNKLDY